MGLFHFNLNQALISPLLSPRNDENSTIFSCLSLNGVSYLSPSSQNWSSFSTVYNLRLQYTPVVITIPISTTEISNTVKCAAKSRLKVQAKGGGHSYGSFSSGGQDGSLIISMENFDKILLDPITFIAKVGTGQRLGNIAQAIYNQGKRALPHGTCPSVGIAGHALHGGYGFASRRWGLTIDHIIGIDVILADGQEIHANETSNPEVFFAMRGASDSIGIATYIYFNTEPAPDAVIHYSVNLGPSIQEDISIAITGFEQLQRSVMESSSLITPENTFNLYVDSSGAFTLNGWCMSCDEENFRRIVLPFILTGFNYSDVKIESHDWIKAITVLAGPKALSQPLGSALKLHESFYAKSLVVPESSPLNTNAIENFFSYVQQNKGNLNWFSLINIYGGPGSVINNPSPLAFSSSYAHRDSLWVFQNYGFSPSPPYDESLTPIIQGFNDVITTAQPSTLFAAYLNYLDPGLSPIEAATLYYGKSTYNRLLEVKKAVDPNFIFWNPQAVGIAPAL